MCSYPIWGCAFSLLSFCCTEVLLDFLNAAFNAPKRYHYMNLFHWLNCSTVSVSASKKQKPTHGSVCIYIKLYIIQGYVSTLKTQVITKECCFFDSKSLTRFLFLWRDQICLPESKTSLEHLSGEIYAMDHKILFKMIDCHVKEKWNQTSLVSMSLCCVMWLCSPVVMSAGCINRKTFADFITFTTTTLTGPVSTSVLKVVEEIFSEWGFHCSERL